VYIVVIPGGFGARLGGQMKKFSTLANARHNPLHKSVNFYPDPVGSIFVARFIYNVQCAINGQQHTLCT